MIELGALLVSLLGIITSIGTAGSRPIRAAGTPTTTGGTRLATDSRGVILEGLSWSDKYQGSQTLDIYHAHLRVSQEFHFF